MYENRAAAHSKCLSSTSLYLSKVGVFKLNTPIKLTAWIPNHTVKVPVPTLGTGKILYKRKLGLLAMYVCTKSVRTYIAKTLKRTIHAILYGTKLTQARAYQNDHLILVWLVLDILSSTTFIVEFYPPIQKKGVCTMPVTNMIELPKRRAVLEPTTICHHALRQVQGAGDIQHRSPQRAY